MLDIRWLTNERKEMYGQKENDIEAGDESF